MVASFLALTSPANLSDMPWFRVMGTKGEVLIRGGFEGGGVELYDEDHPDGQALPGDHGYFHSFKPELEDFAALVLDGKAPVGSAGEGARRDADRPRPLPVGRERCVGVGVGRLRGRSAT